MQLSKTNVQTMLSTEIVKLINENREEGAAELLHKNFTAKIVKVLGEEHSAKFLAQYKDSTGRTLNCYALPKRETNLMVMSESYKVQAAVYDKMVELEKPLSQLEILAQSALALVDMDRRQTALESEVKALAAKIEKTPADYFTVAGFASLRGIKLGNSDANKGGRIASKLSREYGYPINKAHSEIFGEVNTYHVDILTELFDEHQAD